MNYCDWPISKKLIDKYKELFGYNMNLGKETIRIPKEFISYKNENFWIGKTLNFRNSRLKDRSPGELEFKRIFSQKQFEFIDEFQIFIENRNLWNNILDGLNISSSDQSRFQGFFQVDFLFYNSGIIVEIDSAYHDSKKLVDKARDKYLELEYGYKIFRYRYFSEISIDLTKLNSELLSRSEIYKIIPDFTETFERNLRIKDKNLYNILGKIQNYNKSLLYSSENIALTMKDLYNLGWITENRDYHISHEMIRISEYISENYEKTLYIHPGSSQYTTLEVLDLLECPDPWKKWENIVVPSWVIGILGKPEDKKIRYENSTEGISGIKKFIKELIKLNIWHS